MKTAKTITPKNGQFPVALLAGGPADLAREIGQRLREKLGVVVAHHWEDDKPRQWQRRVPDDVDITIFLKDFASHSQDGLISRQCSVQKVPFLRTQRKWATMYSALHAVYGMNINDNPWTSNTAAAPEVTTMSPPNEPAPDWKEPAPVEAAAPAPRKPRQPRAKVATVTALPPASANGPSEEAMVLVAKLMIHAARDRFSVMITPTEVTVSVK